MPVSRAGGVHGDEHDDLWIVRRGKGHEGHHHVAGLALVRRTGLAADAVALHLSIAVPPSETTYSRHSRAVAEVCWLTT